MTNKVLKRGSENSDAKTIRDALGVDDGTVVHVTLPQFERRVGEQMPAPAPQTIEAWSRLSTLSRVELEALGCRWWGQRSAHNILPAEPEWSAAPPEDVSSGDLMLFPGEWFNDIPEGLAIVDIMDRHRTFERSTTSNDIRFGMLAYGVVIRT